MNQSEMDGNLTDLVRQASDMIRQSNTDISVRMNALGEEKRIVNSAQMRSADDLHKFLEQYEQSQKEQAAENVKNRRLAIRSFWVSIAATVFGGCSLLVAIIALALQLSK